MDVTWVHSWKLPKVLSTQMRAVKDFSVIVPDSLGDKEFVEELGHSGSEMQ
jgi:hypothetical protein